MTNIVPFSREKTQILKGIALLLMLVHHTSNPLFWAEEGTSLYTYFDIQGHSTKMCVWIFAFLVGYGYFCSKNKTIKYSLKRILLLVIPFWTMLFCLFVPASYIQGDLMNTLANNHSTSPAWLELIWNMFGFSESLNWYSWFVGFYCLSIIMMSFLHKFFDNYSRCGWFIASIGYYILAIGLHSISNWETNPPVHMMFTTCTLVPLIIVGYQCALWNSRGKIPTWFEGKKRIPFALLSIVAVMLINAIKFDLHGLCIQALYTPFFIFAIVGIFNCINIQWLTKGLTKVGDLSLYMWFFHAIFFTSSVNLYTKNLVFEPIHNYFYTLIMTFILTYVGSWLIKIIVLPIIRR